MKKYSEKVFLGGALVFLGIFFAGFLPVLILSLFGADGEKHMVLPFSILIGLVVLFVGVFLLEKQITRRFIFNIVQIIALCVNLIVAFYICYVWNIYGYKSVLFVIEIIMIVAFETRVIVAMKKLQQKKQ